MKMKAVNYSKAAYTAYTTLSTSDKLKADKLTDAFANGLSNPVLAHKLSKVSGIGGENMFSIRLSPKLRILVEDKEDRVVIVDILNHDLFMRYFHNAQVA